MGGLEGKGECWESFGRAVLQKITGPEGENSRRLSVVCGNGFGKE